MHFFLFSLPDNKITYPNEFNLTTAKKLCKYTQYKRAYSDHYICYANTHKNIFAATVT